MAYYSEFYEIVKTVDLVATLSVSPGSQSRFRIEVLHHPNDQPRGPYSSRVYIEQELTIQPTYPKQGGAHTQEPQSFRVWTDWPMPWGFDDNVDAAMGRALSDLGECCVQ